MPPLPPIKHGSPAPASLFGKSRLRNFLGWAGNPWYLGRFGAGTMARMHRLASRHALVGRWGKRAWLVKLLLTLGWPLRLTVQSWRLVRRFGVEVRQSHGFSLRRQALDLAALGLGFGLPPLAYYQFGLFLPENRGRFREYLYSHEVPALFSYLNNFHADPAVDNKRLFGERCAAAGLASVPLLTWWKDGLARGGSAAWPAGDLISKPAVGSRGEGVRLWRAQGAGCYHGAGGTLDGESLRQQLADSSGGKEWLLQPALANHPQIADLTPGPLVGVRIMTARDPRGACEAFAAILKMPVGRQVLNNHGIGSAIDLENGSLGKAFPYRPLHPGFDRHPNTGARIVGRHLPEWKKLVRLVLAAHALFPGTRLLGWDVALTPEGPVLLETNAGWDVTMPQIALRQPLGATPFAALCRRMLGETEDCRSDFGGSGEGRDGAGVL